MFRFAIILVLFLSEKWVHSQKSLKVDQCHEVRYTIFTNDVQLYYSCDDSVKSCSKSISFNVACPTRQTCNIPGTGIKLSKKPKDDMVYGYTGKSVLQNKFLILPSDNESCFYQNEQCYDSVLRAHVVWKYEKCYRNIIFEGKVNEGTINRRELDLRFISFEYENKNYSLQLLTKHEECESWETDQSNVFVSVSKNDEDTDKKSTSFILSKLKPGRINSMIFKCGMNGSYSNKDLVTYTIISSAIQLSLLIIMLILVIILIRKISKRSKNNGNKTNNYDIKKHLNKESVGDENYEVIDNDIYRNE